MATIPEIYIQWNGTNCSIQFFCECGLQDHIDASNFYYVVCSECKRVYAMPDFVPIEEVDPKVIVGRELQVYEAMR